jgi:hypothetical protein
MKVPPQEISFAHACCRASPVELIPALTTVATEMFAAKATVFNHLTRRDEPIISHNLYFWFDNEHFLLFIPPHYNDLLLKLSIKAQLTLHWMDIYEPMAIRIYLRFEGGRLTEQVIDPEQQIQSGLWAGADLGGVGPRRFSDLQKFMRFVAPGYTPLDQYWSHEHLDDAEMREEGFGSADTRVKWAAMFSCQDGSVVPLGNAPADAFQ